MTAALASRDVAPFLTLASGAPGAHACAIDVIRDRAGFEALRADWTALFERVARPEHVFQSYAWLACWADHFLGNRVELRVVTGRSQGRLTMVWPLALTPLPFGGARLCWMGEPVSQYGDALVEPGPFAATALAEGWRAARDCGADIALLRKTRRDANVALLLEREAIACDLAAAPFAQFDDKADFEAVLAKRSAKARSSRRRSLRRLQETGEIAFSEARDVAATQELLRRAFDFKRAWLAKRGFYSRSIESDATLAFFLDFAARAGEETKLLTHAILRDGDPVAVGVTLACKNAGFGHLLTHDPRCDKQGAGALLAEHVMRSSFGTTLARYDMLAPYDAYKAEWADASVPVADYVAGLTLRGRLLARLWRSGARERLKATLKSMPRGLGRAVWPLARRLARG
ncbi:MAG TPA: GNAT family N-acetyltransferase [Methylocystis sp.]|nr:GNAT family N-acetyltransferase [Methylocystis sp.]